MCSSDLTIAKKGDLHARRRLLTVIRNKDVVHALMAEIGPRFENREGGYTRIVKVGPRKGDNAPMAIIELVEALDAARAAEAIAKRAAKEQARAVLPEGLTVSRMYMNGTLRSWIHYCALRMGPETQKEHRKIATDAWYEITRVFPSLKDSLDIGEK